ncbi:hypothetical protein BCON_0251g00060 [Botryotinia convoluta]|uniref:Major facilitator superfamily (MFS) profile domain-containing protein n=1 Tax=Botryotinia convoluta TaxID=54673 RepID=A0A4Z1HG87_9HELO|nr:hypothetical protein BCON_0251g00060 [Botryotinia convoluta]
MATPDHESHHEVAPRFADVSTTDEASLDTPPEVVAHNSNHSTIEPNGDVPSEWLTGTKLVAVSIAFGIADIMVALDSSILATALPTISPEFKAVSDIGWYGSAYLLAQTSCQPVFGKIYTCFEPKATYLTSLLVFCIGSILCAAAPVSSCLILGRAVTGLAAAGILTGSLTSRGSVLTIFQNDDQGFDTPALSTAVSDIIFRRAIFGRVVPLRLRPQGMAIMVSISSIVSMIGSTVGGVLTDSVLTWRFSFWLNLPLGLACSLVVFYILDRKPHPDHQLPISTKLLKLDPLSFILLLSSMACLFVAVEFGGVSVSWSNSKAWGSVLGFGLLGISFIILQGHQKEKAVVNLRMMRQRTVAICYMFSFAYGLAITTHTWLLPTYFQGVKYFSASISGVLGLSLSIPMTVFSLVTGFSTTRCGHYVPFMWAGALIYVAGSALLYLLTTDSGMGVYISYSVIAGIGCGMAIQVTFIAVQVVVSPSEMAHACSMEVLFRQLGSAIAISVAENIFLSSTQGRLQQLLPQSNDSILKSGIREFAMLSQTLPPAEQQEAKSLISYGVKQAFILPLTASCVAAVASWGMERIKMDDENERAMAQNIELT